MINPLEYQCRIEHHKTLWSHFLTHAGAINRNSSKPHPCGTVYSIAYINRYEDQNRIVQTNINSSLRPRLQDQVFWGLFSLSFGAPADAWPPRVMPAFKLMHPPTPYEVLHKLNALMVNPASQCDTMVIVLYCHGMPIEAIAACLEVDIITVENIMIRGISSLMNSIVFAEWALNADLSPILTQEAFKVWLHYRANMEMPTTETWARACERFSNNKLYCIWLARGYPDSYMPFRPLNTRNKFIFGSIQERNDWLETSGNQEKRDTYIQEREKRCPRPNWI